MSKDKASGVVVRVSGTSPLSFDVTPGTMLTIKEIAPSAANRPTLGSRFKSKGYLLFKGITKIGRLSPSALAKIGESIPANCKVVQVDRAKKILAVEFE